jgi:mRNA interferase RelE/StbE
MAVYRPDIPPHVAEDMRHLAPELKRSVKQALRSLSSDPFSGEPLLRELSGLWKYKVRRFRIVYEVDRKSRVIRIFAIAHRRDVYEELADRIRKAGRNK